MAKISTNRLKNYAEANGLGFMNKYFITKYKYIEYHTVLHLWHIQGKEQDSDVKNLSKLFQK